MNDSLVAIISGILDVFTASFFLSNLAVNTSKIPEIIAAKESFITFEGTRRSKEKEDLGKSKEG